MDGKELMARMLKVTGAASSTISYHNDKVYFRKQGNLVMFQLSGSFTNLPNGGYTTLGTIPSGYRPFWGCLSRQIASAGNASGASIMLRLQPNGTIDVYNYSGATYSGNGYFQGMYTIC